jgi:GAF domain-containing protein
MDMAVDRGETIHTVRSGPGDEPEGDKAALTVPIKIRDKVVAVLDTYRKADGGAWSQEEINFLENIAEQMGVALENARLYESTQMRAERERLVSDITAQVRAAGDVDGILQTAVLEIRRALGASHGVIRLGTETPTRQPDRTVTDDSSNGDLNQ